MEANAHLLSESGPLHTALVGLGVRLSELQHVGGKPPNDPDGENFSKTELQLRLIHEILQQLSHSNKTLQESLSTDIRQLAGQAGEISRGINTDVLETLQSISKSTAGMSVSLDNLKVPNRKPEPKNGFFKKMIRK